MDNEMKDFRSLMKKIIEETNNVLKHSSSAFKKTKEKLIVLNDVKMKPTEKTSEWFSQRGFKKISLPDFFDLVFREAASKNMLDFNTKTIMFDENDAVVFEHPPNTKIHILTFFEHVPKYFI